MYAAIKIYSGDGGKDLLDLYIKNQAEVEALIRGVPGFVSYTVIQNDEGGATVTVCRDKQGIDECVQRSREWWAANDLPDVRATVAVTEGPATMYFT